MTRMARIAALALVPVACCAQDRALLTPAELIDDWKISKQFTIDVAEAMPAEFYGFRPTPKQMTFGGQIVHIAVANVHRFHQLTAAPPPFSLEKYPDASDKESALRLLNQSFDYVIGLLPKITPEQLAKPFKVDWKGRSEVNGRQMMLNMFVHVAHHRAAAEVYLRLKGIEPPRYTF